MTDDVTQLADDELQDARATQPGWTPGPPPPPPGGHITEHLGKRRRLKRVGVAVLVAALVLAGGAVMADRVIKASEGAIVTAARGITRAEQKARALEAVQESVASIGVDDAERFCDSWDAPLARAVGSYRWDCIARYEALMFTELEREAARAGFDADAVDFRINDELPGYVCLWIPSSAWYIQSELSYYDLADVCVYKDHGRWYLDGKEHGGEVVDVDEFAANIMAARVYAKTVTG